MSHEKNISLAQLAAGVVLGLAFGLLLISRLAAAGDEAAGEAAASQSAVVTLSAAADLVAAAQAADEDVQETVRRFADGHDDVISIRVVDVKKRSLLASTLDADGAPVRLQRKSEEHKVWYDLGKSLQAADKANRDEGRLWKELILTERLDDGTLSLSAPLLDGAETSQVIGVVLLNARAEAPSLGTARPSPWLFLLLGTLLALAVAWPLRNKRYPAAAAAGTVAALVLAFFTFATLNALGADRLAIEEAVAERLAADAGRTGTGALDSSTWDVDPFRQPRSIIATDGTIDADAVDASFASTRSRFRNVFSVLSLLGLVLFSFVGLGGAGRTVQTIRENREAYTFIAPAMAGMLFLVFFPFFFGLTLSFTDQTLYNVNEPFYERWVGFDNYVKILTDFNIFESAEAGGGVNYENFYWTLFFTICWTVVNVFIGVTLGMALALALNTKDLAFRPIYRVILILPWAVPNYITALIWKGMFHQQFGSVNQILQILGMEPIAWFDNTLTSFCAVVTTNGWLSFPFMMVVALGGLQSIPADLYEAARIDGANRWQQFTNVTIPALKPVMVPAIILSVVWTFNMFNIIYLVSGGEPGHATEILVTQAFKLFYEQYQYGYAAAYATVIFGILLIYGTWQNRVTKANEGV